MRISFLFTNEDDGGRLQNVSHGVKVADCLRWPKFTGEDKDGKHMYPLRGPL